MYSGEVSIIYDDFCSVTDKPVIYTICFTAPQKVLHNANVDKPNIYTMNIEHCVIVALQAVVSLKCNICSVNI